MNPEAMVYAGVKMTCAYLTDMELAALNNLATFTNYPGNPAQVIGYKKASHLFTEANGTKMHPTALVAFQAVVIERLN